MSGIYSPTWGSEQSTSPFFQSRQKKQLPFFLDTVTDDPRGSYLLDCRTEQYLIVNRRMAQFACGEIEKMQNRGIAFVSNQLWFADDWHTYSKFILPTIAGFYHKQDQTKWTDFEVLLNYRVKYYSGKKVRYRHVMQHSRYIQFSAHSEPELILGNVSDTCLPDLHKILHLKILYRGEQVFQKSFISVGAAFDISHAQMCVLLLHARGMEYKKMSNQLQIPRETINSRLKTIRSASHCETFEELQILAFQLDPVLFDIFSETQGGKSVDQ
ncbi:hypothetical protein [Mucilaginibacter pedocola]|uniref:Uncharacterized protein n=1 Tax=Mucilaginibacter pedocola TaxID=1792845 RepID=A0A1S9P8R2_9SPHI|nr:hypothetical protein [Mucilaginibacter pedocola]OOQ57364.1 hypothetical protein BC343_14770 [Mucilaginibacter pedocola]